MSNAITLPGAIPGLLRRGSPVLVDGLGPSGTVLRLWANGCGGGSGERADVGYADELGNGAPAGVARPPLHRLALDLTDATGRAHAAWWLAAAARQADPGNALWRRTKRGWRTTGHHGGGTSEAGFGDDCTVDLDPADPRLLPDGSRWVDAEALRLVVAHVSGVSS